MGRSVLVPETKPTSPPPSPPQYGLMHTLPPLLTALRSAADLRASTPEERGEGVAASALCNSASLASTSGATSTPPMFQRRRVELAENPMAPQKPPRDDTPPMFSDTEQPQSGRKTTRSSNQSLGIAAVGDAEWAPVGAGTPTLDGMTTTCRPPLRTDTPPMLSSGLGVMKGGGERWRRDSVEPNAMWQDAPALARPSLYTTACDAVQGRSPQPTSVTVARKRAALELAEKLANDVSPYAICPSNPDKIKKMTVAAADARMAAIPSGTASSDAWGFGWAMKFGLAHDTPWMRPRQGTVTAAEELREQQFCVFLIIFMSMEMKASARTKSRGITQANPNSPMGALYGYRRVLRDCGRHLADLSAVAKQLKALRAQYMSVWGDFALVRVQQQPLSRSERLSLLHHLLDPLRSFGSKSRRDGVRLGIIIQENTGMRTAELCDDVGLHAYMKRHNFVPIDGDGNELSVTHHSVANWRKKGAMLKGRTVGSKCDFDNSHWGGRDMYFVYDDTNEFNLPMAWADYELRYPCPPDQRHGWPAISPNGDAMPFKKNEYRANHKQACVAALGISRGRFVTPHVHRVNLATGVMAQPDAEEATAQALVRWKTVDALRIYYKMLPSAYADMVNRATRTDAAKHTNLTIPEIDANDARTRIDDAIAELDSLGGKGPRNSAAAPADDLQRYEIGDGEYVWGDASNAPVSILGKQVILPDRAWPGWDMAMTTTTCLIAAYVHAEEQYVIDTQDGYYYLFKYDQIYPHFNSNLRRSIRSTAVGKAVLRRH